MQKVGRKKANTSVWPNYNVNQPRFPWNNSQQIFQFSQPTFFSEAHACRCHLKETCIDFTAQVGQGLRRTSWKQKSPSFSFEKNPWNGHGCRYWIASTQIEGYGDYFFVFSFKSPSYKVRPLVLRLALRWVENSWSKDNVAKHVWVSFWIPCWRRIPKNLITPQPRTTKHIIIIKFCLASKCLARETNQPNSLKYELPPKKNLLVEAWNSSKNIHFLRVWLLVFSGVYLKQLPRQGLKAL